jgi:hypothetical protein
MPHEIAIALGGYGLVCRSNDGGIHWTKHELPDVSYTESVPIWDGQLFHTWAENRNHYFSADGIHWNQTQTLPGAGVQLGAVERNPYTGTFVGVSSWPANYENQKFYRSSDGTTWDALEENQYTQSHAINNITFGYANPSSVCP